MNLSFCDRPGAEQQTEFEMSSEDVGTVPTRARQRGDSVLVSFRLVRCCNLSSVARCIGSDTRGDVGRRESCCNGARYRVCAPVWLGSEGGLLAGLLLPNRVRKGGEATVEWRENEKKAVRPADAAAADQGAGSWLCVGLSTIRVKARDKVGESEEM